MSVKRLIQPRARTPVPGSRENVVTGRLPEDLLSEQVQRFAVYTIVAGGLWAFGLMMHLLIVPRTFGTVAPRIAVVIEVIGVLTSALAFWYIRYVRHESQVKANAGLWFMLLNAFGVAMFNVSRGSFIERPGDLSWNTIVILVFSMIMPTSPAKMLAASMAAASTDPLATWIAHLRGADVPSLANTLVLFTPNYVCAVVAVWPAYALQCIGRRLREAQEMGSYQLVELLSGRDLESLVREFGPLPAERALFILRQICHSLADAHARGLVHRDIKPANVYVCRMGLEYDFVKVLDFGLVKFSGKTAMTQTMTADHMTSGTPAFMAPEVILGEKEVDRRADVYALGCVAYYLLTGQLVFEADTPMKMLLHHVQTPPIPPSQRTELPIPREMEEMVMACLEKDPARRPQDAEQLFRLAQRCGSGATWDRDAARRWWELNLAELTGPLTLGEIPSEVVGTAATLQ